MKRLKILRLFDIVALAWRVLLVGIVLGSINFESATARTYPSRPITIIVPFPPGGISDPLARILAERMKVSLGQPLIIQNVPGAGGSIGVGRAARSKPDGYTLVIGHLQTHVLNGAVLKLDYDVLKDFEPISLIGDTPFWLIAKNDFPANDLKDMIAWLKANPDKASAATVGFGGAPHILAIDFQDSTGTHFSIVPYLGGSEAVQSLMAGQVDFYFDAAANSLAYVRSGKVKVLALLAKKRWWAAPDVPTAEELGVTGIDMSLWNGLWAPKGTPKDIIAKLNAAIVDTLADPATLKKLKTFGLEIPTRDQQTPEALAGLQKAEAQRWWPIIQAYGIKE